jgi:hypothetical protein
MPRGRADDDASCTVMRARATFRAIFLVREKERKERAQWSRGLEKLKRLLRRVFAEK